jgi:hypothetical protein
VVALNAVAAAVAGVLLPRSFAAPAEVLPSAAAVTLTVSDPADAAARMLVWGLTPAAVAAVSGRVGRLTPVQLRALADLPFLEYSQVAQLHVVAAIYTPETAARAQPAVQVVRALRSLLQAALLPDVTPSVHFETIADCFARRAGCSSSLLLSAKCCEARSGTPVAMSILHQLLDCSNCTNIMLDQGRPRQNPS